MILVCDTCLGSYPKTNKSHKYKCNPCYQKQYYRKDKQRRLELNKQWRKNNPEKRAEQSWKEHRLRRYGLTKQAFEEIYKNQDGKCAICRVSKPAYSIQGLCVDHDHKTGRIRGLLCSLCNTGIGALRESKGLMEEAINYLTRSVI